VGLKLIAKGDLRGLLGTALIGSGPIAAILAVATAAWRLPESAIELGFVILLRVTATCVVITAPLGSLVRRGTRWTQTARFDRRQALPIGHRGPADFVLAASSALAAMLGIGSACAIVLMAGLQTIRDNSASSLFAVLVSHAFSFAMLGISVIAILTFTRFVALGFWLRTAWGRRFLQSQLGTSPKSVQDLAAELESSELLRQQQRRLATIGFVICIVLAIALVFATLVSTKRFRLASELPPRCLVRPPGTETLPGGETACGAHQS
jgi:hypothetical protein